MKYSSQCLRRLLLSTLLLLNFVYLQAKDYVQYADEIRTEVWNWNIPDFNNRSVPAEYKDQSVVVLAAHTRVIVNKKTKVNWDKLFYQRGILGPTLTCTYTYRMLIAINDKTARDKYSEFDYKVEEKDNIYFFRMKSLMVLGVRVIKPDGTMKEVDTEEYVNLTTGMERTIDRQKVAIPGLQVGDIIDVFWHENIRMDNMNLDEPFVFSFTDKYPVLSYSVHCEIDGDLTTEYRSLNGAPQFKKTQDKDGNYILDVSAEKLSWKIPKIWYNESRQSPVILMNVLNNNIREVWKPASSREKGIYANISPYVIYKDSFFWFDRLWNEPVIQKVKKEVKAYRKRHPYISEEKLADIIYQMLYYYSPNYRYSGTQRFAVCLSRLFDLFKIKHQLGLVISNRDIRLNDIITYWDPDALVRLNTGKVYIYSSEYLFPGEIPAQFQGEPIVLKVGKTKHCSLVNDSLPANSAYENNVLSKLNVSFSGEELNKLTIERDETRRGTLRSLRSDLVLYEDWELSLRTLLELKGGMLDRYSRESRNEWMVWLQENRENEKERYEKEINTYHADKAEEVLSYKTLNIGNLIEKPYLNYQVKYIMDGYVRKAGPHKILSVGKLVEHNILLKNNERQRTVDIYRYSADSYDYEINIVIPAGYNSDRGDWDKLNICVENECGAFITTIKETENGILLKVHKQFNNAYEPAANWNKLTEIIDAAVNFEYAVLVLKKDTED